MAQKADDDSFVWLIRNRLATLDPAEVSEDANGQVLRQVFEGLAAIDERGVAQPLLATSWQPNDDATEFLFRLRQGVTFSDGTVLDARTVKASFDRLKAPGLSSGYARTLLQNVKTVEVIDASAVRFKMDRPLASLPARLAYPALAITGRAMPRDRAARSPQELIGTGPFTLFSAEADRLEFKGRTNYHLTGPLLQELSVRVVGDAATRYAMLRDEKADLALLAPADAIAAGRESAFSRRLRRTPRAAVAYLQIQPSAYPPTRSAKVRRAIWHALDRDELVADVQGGINLRADGFVPPGVPGYERATPRVAFDPVAARTLLAEAGYPDPAKLPPITITVVASAPGRATAERLAGDLRSTLGLNVSVEALAPEAIAVRNRAGRLPFFVTGWTGDYSHPDDYLPMLFGSVSSENRTGYRNKKVDDLFAQAASQENVMRRDDLYDRAHKIVLADSVAIPLYFPVDVELTSAKTRGLLFTPFGHGSFAEVTKRPRLRS